MALKSSAKKKETGTEIAVVDVKPNSKQKVVFRLVDIAIAAAGATLQSVQQLELRIKEASEACLLHAEEYGDAMPADRLVKGLMGKNHPTTTSLARELVIWFNSNSPIRWNAKGQVRIMKDTEEGYKPFDEVSAKETSFTETPQAERARKAADTAHKRALKPYTLKDFTGRLEGLRAQFKRAQEPDKNGDVRGIVKGDMPKIKSLLKAVDSMLIEEGFVKDEKEKAAA